MNPRNFIDFFRSPSGRFLAFGAILGSVLALVAWYRGQPRESIPGVEAEEPDTPQRVQSFNRPMQIFRPPLPPSPEPSRPSTPTDRAVRITQESPPKPVVHTSLSLVADTSAGKPQARRMGSIYAPYGRLISCETVITVDSSVIQTPIVGLITEDVHHAGQLVIPAGTEVHGTAQADHTRERIASGASWTLVWQSGQELTLRAIALDREFETSTNHVGWGITDGSAGLRGRLIKSDELSEVRLFAATFLKGAAGALTEEEGTLLGPITSPSLNNAPLQGAEEVLGVYARQIYESIQRDGFYVRIPSGKQFYLYVLQSIDLAEARLVLPLPDEPFSRETP